ncbi:ribosome maturation factor RimM [Parasulfuritortus cantonensis]|uniref:Ribosome maturation factor RimM n=1 Tax=Parasulfuritortus cantonensis TaxID=2528202 RepID=A0A4R1BGF9_9PROT|nr:ribosome maturation factor RimM [Parasulfuritortus cantonensis]TCJ16315.1 ribosome maturation factor RimM [Parasulfuritortus cantonensis]
MGRIAAPYAVRGWVKVQPFTEYLDNLLDYPVWHLGKAGRWREYKVLEAKVHSQFLLAQLDGVADRDAAEALQGQEVAVARAELPAPEADEYYWDDLVGLEVVNLAGEALGRVAEMLETGAHDIMRVTAGDTERLIPFTAPIVATVDIAAGRIVVDWGTDW